ncbi:MAG: hypothetical protein AAF789_09010 [Bacteroidota bacterium]
MRLGQLARKYEITVHEILEFLDENRIEQVSKHPNSKLSEEAEQLLARHFNQEYFENEPSIIVEELEGPTSAAKAPDDALESDQATESLTASTSTEVIEDEAVSDTHQMSASADSVSEIEEQKHKEPAREEISTDQFLALTEAEENDPVHLEQITHIKAPKKELSGLKVLGKIELPKEPVKAKKEDTSAERTSKHRIKGRKGQQPLSPEQEEEKRIRQKQRKEARLQREEKQRKAARLKKEKQQKEAHYQEKVAKVKTPIPKGNQKKKTRKAQQAEQIIDTRPAPKTLLGKFWRWLNT